MKKRYTPDEIIKVASEILNKQQKSGYKPGWTRHEMERRAEKAERNNGSFFLCDTNPRDLGWQVYYIATGKQTIDDLQAALNDKYEMMREMEAMYQ
jgi:hypothetical protein